jgi:phosphoserine phosphatase RsbU/P
MELYSGLYFTLCYVVYNFANSTLRYSGAGHPPLVLLNESGINSLESQNIFIGAVDSLNYQYDELKIDKTSSLYIFSDGVFELEKPNKEMYTFSEFQKVLQEFHVKSDPGLLNLYRNAQKICGKEFLEDDFSLLTVRFNSI